MRFALTDDQVEFRDAVRGLLADTCPPEAVRAAWTAGREDSEGASADVPDGRVPAAWSALAEMGVLGVMVPESAGGLGMDDEDMVPLLVECGRVALPDPVAATAYTAAGQLAAAGGADDVLAQIATGDASVAVGFGPDAVVAGAGTADWFLLGDALDGGAAHLLPAGSVTLEHLESVDGTRDLARVGWSAADGRPAGDAASLRSRAATGTAAVLVGLGRTMVDLTVAYAAERQQFGVPIGSFQAVKHHLADASMHVEFAEPLVSQAANSLAHGAPEAALHASMAKAKASDAARGAAAAALQCHGAIGYTVEYDLHLFMKRAWALAVEAGDAETHRRLVRSALLG